MVSQAKPQVSIGRNVGHPGTARPGFDLLDVVTKDRATLERYLTAARAKFWKPWIVGLNAALLYKPCGANAPWQDTSEDPHPGNPHLRDETPEDLALFRRDRAASPAGAALRAQLGLG